MLRTIEVASGHILVVETEAIDEQQQIEIFRQVERKHPGLRSSLPLGAEPVTAAESALRAAAILEDQIHSLGAIAQQVLEKTAPEEVALEAHIKFAGDVNVIPFLVSTKGEGGLKLTVKWKRSEP